MGLSVRFAYMHLTFIDQIQLDFIHPLHAILFPTSINHYCTFRSMLLASIYDRELMVLVIQCLAYFP
jgi:hypothetical protein